jgi:hypothetical protein
MKLSLMQRTVLSVVFIIFLGIQIKGLSTQAIAFVARSTPQNPSTQSTSYLDFSDLPVTAPYNTTILQAGNYNFYLNDRFIATLLNQINAPVKNDKKMESDEKHLTKQSQNIVVRYRQNPVTTPIEPTQPMQTSVENTPTPTPQPTATVTPTPVVVTPSFPDALQNPDFETTTGGWVSNWNKSTDNYTVDTDMHGDSGTNSIHLLTETTDPSIYLFSDIFTIDAGATYQWNQFIQSTEPFSDFNFYIDEYDKDGNWISGQWRAKITSPFTGVKTWTYTPTSTNVHAIRLQYFTTAGTKTDIYLDSVSLSK